VKRPEGITDEHLEYLDELRESGVTNMYGAGRFLEKEFPDLIDWSNTFRTSKKAQEILGYWMKSFGKAGR